MRRKAMETDRFGPSVVLALRVLVFPLRAFLL